MENPPLSIYLSISSEPPSSYQQGVELEGRWLVLKVPLGQWPKALLQRWEQELFYLFAPEHRLRQMDERDLLVLCHEVEPCEKKDCTSGYNKRCEFYNRGICVRATAWANDLRPLSFGTIGAFNGLSKQRVQQIYVAAQRKVIQAASNDPVLREYYMHLGMAPENMPDPEEIASNIEALLR